MNHSTIPLDPTKTYAPWVYQHGLQFPYGKCQCGCGQHAQSAVWGKTEAGWLKDHPKRFIHGHQGKGRTEQNFWDKVAKKSPDECWEWQATKVKGYGRLARNGTLYLAHRISYELHFGFIPEGMNVLHRCDNPSCVNPNHLFLGTQSDNVQDMYAKGKNPRNRGEQHPKSKVGEADVREIRRRYATGILQRVLAAEYGLRQSVISAIIRRETWKHVR